MAFCRSPGSTGYLPTKRHIWSWRSVKARPWLHSTPAFGKPRARPASQYMQPRASGAHATFVTCRFHLPRARFRKLLALNRLLKDNRCAAAIVGVAAVLGGDQVRAGGKA